METSKNSDIGQKGFVLRRDIPTQNARVVLIRDVLRHIENPSYQNSIRAFGFDVNFFNKLLNGTHNDWVVNLPPTDYPPAQPIERITIRTAVAPDGKTVEATLTTMFAPSTMKVRLPKPPAESIGFESILLQEGSITYDVLHGFNHTAGVYTAEGTPSNVTLEPGDLLIVPRGVARQVSKVTPGSKYLYIGDPWSDNDLPAEITFPPKPMHSG